MKFIFTLVLTLMMFLFPFISHEALAYATPTPEQINEPNYFMTKTTWFGGAAGDRSMKIEGKTLGEIAAGAFREAAFSGEPVQYTSEDGKIVYWAYPVFGKSKCERVYEKAWQDGKMVVNKFRRVCLVNERAEKGR